MGETARTFAPGQSEIFWCQACNVPLLSEKCSICANPGQRIDLSPPADVRLCSIAGRELLRELFKASFGYADLLEGRIILLNKIAGLDRRDQVILDGYHIATLWFDITTGTYKLDLELAGAVLLAGKAEEKVVVCKDSLMRGHIKGKWIDKEHIESQPGDLVEGDHVILKIGKFSGVGTVRRRGDGSLSIRVKEVTQRQIELSDCIPTMSQVLKANESHLKKLEKTALRELRSHIDRSKLPVNVSFSGGKDSLASLCLGLKVRPSAEVLFINTGLEFPETVDYVHSFCQERGLKLHEIHGDDQFFDQIKKFGPPAKDFRWCCKTNKLGPLTSFIQKQYPKGCLTIEGRRIYESFSRSRIGAVEKNPYVPNQLTISPIRDWRAIEVMLYIYWNNLTPNPLYECDYERIGCWLCPASLQSEFARMKGSHPQLYEKWNSYLQRWAEENKLDPRYVDLGFWRWRRHPPKIQEIAGAQKIDLWARPSGKKEVRLEMVKGVSPCGLEYSIDANLTMPQNYPFPMVANALSMLGEVKYSESLGAANLKTASGKCTAFASGHLFVIAPKDKADEELRKVVETMLRVQTCTRCRICEKSCRQRAITVKDTITVDEKRCNRCGRCSKGCIAVAEASKLFGGNAAKKKRSARQRS